MLATQCSMLFQHKYNPIFCKRVFTKTSFQQIYLSLKEVFLSSKEKSTDFQVHKNSDPFEAAINFSSKVTKLLSKSKFYISSLIDISQGLQHLLAFCALKVDVMAECSLPKCQAQDENRAKHDCRYVMTIFVVQIVDLTMSVLRTLDYCFWELLFCSSIAFKAKVRGWLTQAPRIFSPASLRVHHWDANMSWVVSWSKRWLMIFAGTPATMVQGGTSFVTTAPLPMMAPSPTVMPDLMTAP